MATARLIFASLEEETDYSDRLFKAILSLFISKMPPVLLKESPHISEKLTMEEMQRIQKKYETEGSHSAARFLLEILITKPNWFDAFMNALDDEDLRLQEFKPQFLAMKAKVDEEWTLNHPAVYNPDWETIPIQSSSEESGDIAPLPQVGMETDTATEGWDDMLTIGERVMWRTDNGNEYGSVRWIGTLPNDTSGEVTVGVDFDNPIGTGTGKYKGERLFYTKDGHASLVPLKVLIRAEPRDEFRLNRWKKEDLNKTMAEPKAMPEPKSAEGKDWDEYLEELIHVFKPVLLDTMRASHIVWLLTIKEVQDKAGIIVQKDNAGDFTGAAEDLLDAIRSSNQPGKWQMFIDALREVDNTQVLQILLEEKSQLNNDDNRQLIRILSPKIIEFLNLSPLLNKMFEKRLIVDTDVQLLRSMINNGKKRPANGVLLLIMHRHSEDWYNIFMGILCDNGDHFELAKSIDEKFCIKRKAVGDGGAAPSSSDEPRLEPLERERTETVQSEVKAEGTASTGVKVMDAKLGDHQSEEDVTSASARLPGSVAGEATCQCQCCAQVLSRMTALQGELDEMKALVGFLVNKFP